MLKINTNFKKHRIPLILGTVGISGICLFSYLTFIPTQTFANGEGTIVDPNEHRTLSQITYMQDMSQQICINSAEEETKQLIDTRDNKPYWVAKLKDGNCWMTQNLDLNLSNSKALTPADSDVTSDWVPTHSTLTGNAGNTGGWLGYYNDLDDRQSNAIDSWEPSNYYYAIDTQWTNCGTVVSMSSCTKWLTSAPEEDQHYHVGNYYSWNAATAGTGGSITSSEASGSICPKGWQLPTSNNTASGSFNYLIDRYNIVSSNVNDTLRQAPLYFIPAGGVYSGGLDGTGQHGVYWSSIAYSYTQTYNLWFVSGAINASNYYLRDRGYPIRCLSLGGWPSDNSRANVAITVSPVISIDATSGMSSAVDFTTVALGDIKATVSSNQAYQVLLGTNQSTLEQDPSVANQNIPMVEQDTTITASTRAWGIKKTNSVLPSGTLGDSSTNTTLYSPIGINNDKVLFYRSQGAESKTLIFPVAISVDSTLPSGVYSTMVTITAVGN